MLNSKDARPKDPDQYWDLTPEEIWEMYREAQTDYASRNMRLATYEDMFSGHHWPEEEPDDENSFQLVFNYCRATVMKYASILSELPRVRIPLGTTDLDTQRRTRRRERLLYSIWDYLQETWMDVEWNAAKKSFGVLQVLWDPGPNQPESVTIGPPGDTTTRKQYTRCPFRFRSIPPERFFPTYRTNDSPRDFLYVIRFDPDRLVEDIEEEYGVSLQPTNVDLQNNDGTTTLVEFWSKGTYHLIAYTMYTQRSKGQYPRGARRGSAVTLRKKENRYGTIPFFVLQNIRNADYDPCDEGSLSDVDMIMTLNQHYNLMQSEAAEEIATNIHRPLVYYSDDHQQDPQDLEMKAGAVYPVGAEETLEPLAWQPMPESVQNHMSDVLTGIKDLAGLGPAGFGEYPSGATGVGLRIILQSLEQVLALKIPRRVACLREVVELVLKTAHQELKRQGREGARLAWWFQDRLGRFGQLDITAEDIAREYFVNLDYGNLMPRDEVEHQQNEIYKLKAGAQSLWLTLDNIGIDDPDSEIERIKEEAKDEFLNPEKVLAQLQVEQLRKELQAVASGAGVPGAKPALPGGAGGSPQGPNGAGKPTGNNPAPPVPANPQIPGEAVPAMQRTPGPNMQQMMGQMPPGTPMDSGPMGPGGFRP